MQSENENEKVQTEALKVRQPYVKPQLEDHGKMQNTIAGTGSTN